MRTTSWIIRAGAVAIAAGLALAPSAAFAHAERSAGPFDYEIGFGTEPAYVDQPNSVELILNKNGKPVNDMTDQLKVSVSFGDQSTDLSFEPNFEAGGDGDYRAWFVPSQPGKYTFHLTGKLDGTTFDETVTSGPDTFDEVQSIADASFPQVQAPTTDELATKIDQDATRSAGADHEHAGRGRERERRGLDGEERRHRRRRPGRDRHHRRDRGPRHEEACLACWRTRGARTRPSPSSCSSPASGWGGRGGPG